MATVRVALEVDPTTGKARLVEFAKGLDKVDESAQKASKAAKDLAKDAGEDLAAKLGPAGKVMAAMGPAGLAAAAGLGAAAVAAVALVGILLTASSNALAYGGNVQDMAAKNQMGVESFQALSVAAGLSGVQMETVTKGVTVMQKQLAEAPESFKRIGLEAEKLKAMDPGKAFQTVAEQIARIPEPSLRTAAALEFFSKAGPDVVKFAESIGAVSARAEELGLVMGKDVIDGLDATGDSLSLMRQAWEHLWLNIGASIATAPGVRGAIDDIATAIGFVSRTILENKGLIQGMATNLVDAARGAAVLTTAFLNMHSGLASLLERLGGLKLLLGATLGASSGVFALARIGAASRPREFVGPPAPTAADRAAMEFQTKAAAERQAAAAKRAQEVWERAAVQARKEWDKFYLDFEIRGIQAIGGIQKAIDEHVKKIAEANTRVAMSMLAAQTAERESTIAAFLDEAEAAAAAAIEADEQWLDRQQALIGSVHDLAGALGFLGDVVGGTFGEVLKLGANVGHSIGDIISLVTKLRTNVSLGGLSGAGGIGGFLGKVGAGLGIAGAAFSIGKSIVGAIFGNKEEERKREQERAAMQQKAITDLQALQERMERFRMDKVKGEVAGVTAMFKGLAVAGDVTQERIDRLGRLGAAALAQLKAEGLSTSEAMQVFAPALDAAIEAAAKAGLELPPALAALAAFRQKLVDNPELVAANEGWAAFVEGVLATGAATKEVMADLLGEQKALFDQMIEKGFTVPEALAEQARGLYALQQAAEAGRISVDAETQALIDQAEALGLFENLKDPMAELVEIQRLMLETTAALAKVFGAILPAEVQKYIDKLRQIPQVTGPGISGGGEGTAHIPAPDSIQGFAHGGYVPASPPMGRLVRVAERVGEFMVPEDRRSTFAAGTPSAASMSFSYAPQIGSINVTGGEPGRARREVYQALRDRDADLEAQIRRVVREETRGQRR